MLLLGAAGIAAYLTQPWHEGAKPPPTLAVLRVTPDQVEFAEQRLRVAGPASVVTLANGGGVPVRVRSVRIEGANAAEFTLGESQCSLRELGPGETCTIKVSFVPGDSGMRVATLAIAAEGMGAAIKIGIQGRGAELAAAAPTPTPAPGKPAPPAALAPTPPPEHKPEVATVPPKILSFEYEAAGDTVRLCYRLEGAATATITPEPGAVKTVKPSAKECVSVSADAGKTYTLTARSAGGQVVARTPAGTFKALRVELNSSRQAKSGATIPEPQRVQYVIWYASEAKRTVKHVRTVWAASGARLDEHTYELVKYRVQ